MPCSCQAKAVCPCRQSVQSSTSCSPCLNSDAKVLIERQSCPCSCGESSTVQDILTGEEAANLLKDTACCQNPCSTQQNIHNMQENFCPCSGADCSPIYPNPSPMAEREYRECVDPNGCTALYPAECRSTFWPSFAHPRWLCCSDLYCSCKS